MATTPKGQQPEALATFAAAAKAGGKKPASVGMTATPKTAPMKGDLKKEQKTATKVLAEGATGKSRGADKAVKAMPDRTRK